MARSGARGTDPARSSDLVDSTVGNPLAHLCRACRFWHRDHRHRAARVSHIAPSAAKETFGASLEFVSTGWIVVVLDGADGSWLGAQCPGRRPFAVPAW